MTCSARHHMKTGSAAWFLKYAPRRTPLVLFAVLGAGLIKLLFAAPPETDPALAALLAAYKEGAAYGGITVESPLDETLFPPDIAAPRFRWRDKNGSADIWLVTIKFSGRGGRMDFLASGAEWCPSDDDWELIKRRSLERTARLTIAGASRAAPGKILSAGGMAFTTSRDPVDAPLVYREVILPFSEAVKDPSRLRWRMGKVSSKTPPPVILENLPVCGNCHSFSADGSVLGMDVDYANDKGSYAISPVLEEVVLDKGKILNWSDYNKEDKEPTFGLLSQVSPDGQYVVSTVKDRSVFVARPDLAFSQLFFPVKGILAVYSRADKTFRALPGADDKTFVQSNPAWSPDGKRLVFARSRAYRLKNLRDETAALLSKEECDEFLEGGRKFLYDLYTIPFNGGKGGTPEPLKGASDNGMSNFFPKYSPDGKWLVFTRAKSFMLLQPDSELYILPAGGGEARKMRCNTRNMNSWHSWSPNGRWLVFSSKANSAYTQLFLTHIDREGRDSPPVLLANFTSPDRAANIPEFIAEKGSVLKRIREKFLDDVSFLRAGFEHTRAGDTDKAIAKYRKALELNADNPQARLLLGMSEDAKGNQEEAFSQYTAALKLNPGNPDVLTKLGIIMSKRGDLDGAIDYYRKALKLRPESAMAHYFLANALGIQSQLAEEKNRYHAALQASAGYTPAHADAGSAAERRARLDEAIKHYRAAVQLQPGAAAMHSILASALETRGSLEEAIVHYREAVKLGPNPALAHNDLASALEARGSLDEAAIHYREAIELEPEIAVLHTRLGNVLERLGKTAEAVSCYRKALSIDPSSPGADFLLKNALQRGGRQ